MQYTTLGETDLRVSEIGLGTWSFNSSVYGPVAESEAQQAIQAAREAGINFFDTAPLYGDAERDGIAEEVLGRGLRGWRDQAIISTKFGRKPTEGKVAVPGMTEWVQAAYESASLFSELDIGWAIPGERIDLEGYGYFPSFRAIDNH
jgi:aryl-alcohol dehydrogenase-like predicted oxidoreductase